jgi:hypothetical protein
MYDQSGGWFEEGGWVSFTWNEWVSVLFELPAVSEA